MNKGQDWKLFSSSRKYEIQYQFKRFKQIQQQVMSRLKKRWQMQQISQQNKIYDEELDNYVQQQSDNIFWPTPTKTTNISMFLSRNNEQKRKKRFIKNNHSSIINNNRPSKNISHFSNHPYHHQFRSHATIPSPSKNISDKKVLTLQVNDDIKAYYQLLDLTESLDALIIKYYKDPLLSTILMDSNIDVKTIQDEGEGEAARKEKQEHQQQRSKLKQQENRLLYGRKTENIRIKLEKHQQQLSSVFQSDSQSSKNEEASQNEENSWNSSSMAEFNVKGKPDIQPKLEQPNPEQAIQQEGKNGKQHCELDELPINKENIKDNRQQQILLQNFYQNGREPKLSDLHNWLKQMAVFIDKLSSQQFKKLFKLKQLLNLILRSVNKSVKKQLDQFYMELQNKQKKNKAPKLEVNSPKLNESKQDIFWQNYDEVKLQKYKTANKVESNEDDHHVCRICWQYFVNGHQLGGHMSKKHPGHSLEYRNKELIKTRKVIERERRLYFRMIRGSAKETKACKEERKTKIEN